MPFMAVAAVAAGVGVATGVVAATTVAMIGIGATVVGKITKSKELMQIGAGLSLGAGVASVASGIFGGTSAAAGTAEAATAGIGSAAESIPGIDAAAGLGEAAAGAGETASALDAASSISGNTGGLLGASDTIAQSGGLTDAASAVTGVADVAPAAGRGILNAPLAATPSAEFMAANPGFAAPINAVPSASMALTPPPPGGFAGWWKNLSAPMKDRILQMGAQAAGGMFEGWTAEQKLELERERLNLEKQKQDQSQKNASAQPIVRFQNVAPPTRGILRG